MTGIPGGTSTGFCMMDPEVLKKQRITFMKYWMNRLAADLNAVKSAS